MKPFAIFLLGCFTLVIVNASLKEGERPPTWVLDGENPLKKAREDNQTVLLAFWNPSMKSSLIQAAKMYQWLQILKEYKDDFKVVVVNRIGKDKGLIKLDKLSRKGFYLYQDTSDADVWKLMQGKENSLYVFGGDGVLVRQLHGNNSYLGKKNPKCKHIKRTEIISLLLKEMYKFPISGKIKCSDRYLVRYRTVVKGVLKAEGKKEEMKKRKLRKKDKKNRKNQKNRKIKKNKNKRKNKREHKKTKKKDKNRREKKGKKRKRNKSERL